MARKVWPEEFRKVVAQAIGSGAHFTEVAASVATKSRPFSRVTISRWLAEDGPEGEQFREWVKEARERTEREIRERMPIANKAYRVAVLAEAHEKVRKSLENKAYPSEGLVRSLLAIQKEVAEEIGDRIEKKEIAGVDGAPLIAGFTEALEKAYGSDESSKPD